MIRQLEKDMNYFKVNFRFLSLMLIVFFGCKQIVVQEPEFKSLKILDKETRKQDSLYQFTTFNKSKVEINYTRVCNPELSDCEDNEVVYSLVLKEYGIPLKVFNNFVRKMDDLELRTYYRYGDYSIWVKGGAMGHIYGYLINHNRSIKEIESFKLNNRYFIEAGEKLDENIFYFTGD